jgi:hypothetical protein
MGDMANLALDQAEWDIENPDYNDRPHRRRKFDTDTVWVTREGDLIKIVDMTDSHITNAIQYCKERENWHAVEVLSKEKQRRIDAAFFGVKITCQFCQGTMTRQECHSDPEEGVGMGWIKYAFICNKCGASGPLHDKHESKKAK